MKRMHTFQFSRVRKKLTVNETNRPLYEQFDISADLFAEVEQLTSLNSIM